MRLFPVLWGHWDSSGLAALPRKFTVPGKQDTRACKQVCVNKCGSRLQGIWETNVTRKFMASPGDRGLREGLGVRNVLSGLRKPGKVPRRGESGGGV